MRIDVWMDVNELVIGDLVITADNRSAREIVRFGPTFNGRMRTVAMHDEPHVLADFDRHGSVKIACRADWAIDSNGIVSLVVDPVRLPAQDSRRRSRRAMREVA